ncbi:MAG: glycoside hydrolase family 15 protein [Armatimonadota bacterium]
MPVFQPNAVLGNSRSLVTLGGAGEIMTFFYPHIDFPQNVQEGMPAVYIGTPGHGHLSWTFDEDWQNRQSYVPRRNILVTTLVNPAAGLELVITDLMHPRRDLFARRFLLRNISQEDREGVLMQYLYLRLGEIPRKNSARRLDEQHAIVQYWRHICFAMGGDPPDATQIGKAGGLSSNSAKHDMQDGYLSNQREELGDVDTARAWNFWLRPGEEFEKLFIISAGTNEPSALAQLTQSYQRGFQELYEMADHWWDTWLSAAVPVNIAADLTETYYRSLLATRLLYDERYGSFLAAPEFDPMFERCGGYGFVWPRDAAEVVLALEEAGLSDMVERFFEWARTTQRTEGYWEQRYWISGERGPGWCSFLDSIQIDQTGSMIHALGVHADRLPTHERPAFHERYWTVVENAVNYLMAALGENGLHTQAFDLWEKYRGSFTYSNASIYAALQTAARWAEARGQEERGEGWRQAAERIKSVLLTQCWNGSYFARGFSESGQIDWTVDSSILGVYDPFGLLSLDVPEERQMVESMVRVIRERLAKRLPDGEAIIRHEGDDYVDGSAGGVNTLWLARVMLRLANYYADRDPEKSTVYRESAEQYMRVVISRGTSTGLLPELIGSTTVSRWAAPHGWAMGSFIECALLLAKLEKTLVPAS